MVRLNRRRFMKLRSKSYKKRALANVSANRKSYLRKYRAGPLTNYPLPRMKICRLKYVESISINPAMGAVGSFVFSANGLYDPNITGIGHQPYGFDQMMAFYNHYQVLGAKITVTFTNSQEGSGFWCGIKLDDSGTLITASPQFVLEQPYVKRKLISSQYVGKPSITSTFSARKFFSARALKNEYNSTLSGDAANNPADQAYFIVMLAPYTSTQDVGNMPAYVEIEYITKFYEPKELPDS